MLSKKQTRLFPLAFLAITFTSAQLSYGQGFFTRDLPSFGASVNTSALTITDFPESDGSLDAQSNFGALTAMAGAASNSSSPASSANATVAGTASSLTPVGVSTTTPTVDASLSVQLIGSAANFEGFLGFAAAAGVDSHPDFNTIGNNATALSNFVVGGPTPQFFLHGTMNLVAAGTSMGDADLTHPAGDGGAVLSGRIGPWFVDAEYMGNDSWDVTGELPAGIDIDYTTSSLNDYFNFTVPVQNMLLLDFLASISLDDGGAYADDDGRFGDSPAQLNYSFHAASWAVLTATIDAPLLGDLDGDGDSDIDDYVIVFQGQGIGQANGFGATLSDGDTNQDGIVNVTDLQNVLNSSGLSIPGDFDGNLTVGNSDLTLLQDNFGAAASPYPAGWIGDLPTAPSVGNDELTRLLDNWGNDYSAGLRAVAVPEPSSLLLLTCLLSITGLSRDKCYR